MFKTIIVALDMSPMAEDVFKKALSLAKNYQAELLLLHVISSEEDNSPLAIPPNLFDFYPVVSSELTLETWQKEWENYFREGMIFLDRHSEIAIAENVKVIQEQLQGSASRTICQFAKDKKADLIVMGRRGRSGLSEILLGSVSNYVLHNAPCSVLIVQKS